MIRTLISAAALLASAVMAQAATVSQTQDFSGPAELTFAGFDAGLGTLTGVVATFDITATIRDGGLNARNGASVRYRGNVNGAVSVSGVPQLATTFSISGPEARCAANSNLNNNCRASFDAASRVLSFATSASDLSAFASTVKLVIGFSTTVDTITGTYRGNLNRDWTGSGSVMLTFTYTPPPPPVVAVLPAAPVSVVPLPAGAPLLLAGLGALGLAGMRRRRRG